MIEWIWQKCQKKLALDEIMSGHKTSQSYLLGRMPEGIAGLDIRTNFKNNCRTYARQNAGKNVRIDVWKHIKHMSVWESFKRRVNSFLNSIYIIGSVFLLCDGPTQNLLLEKLPYGQSTVVAEVWSFCSKTSTPGGVMLIWTAHVHRVQCTCYCNLVWRCAGEKIHSHTRYSYIKELGFDWFWIECSISTYHVYNIIPTHNVLSCSFHFHHANAVGQESCVIKLDAELSNAFPQWLEYPCTICGARFSWSVVDHLLSTEHWMLGNTFWWCWSRGAFWWVPGGLQYPV